jgi:transposase InsO family protein
MVKEAINKTMLAKALGISRSSLYYEPKRPITDEEIRRQVESVLADHPDYGHKRIALHLRMNKKRILRIMKKFNLKPYRRKTKKPIKKCDNGKPASAFTNLIESMITENAITQPNLVWGTDFTYIPYRARFIYLATVIDLFTREIVGANISRFHNRLLVLGALLNALEKHSPPAIIHSDQGSEYNSEDFIEFARSISSQISMSRKAHPWENGHQESFYGKLKVYLGDINRFESLGELIEEIYQSIYYYNHQRIHTALKMPPYEYRQKYYFDNSESLSKELGT